jgi:phytoene dehydrogenase-like protein
MDEVVVVGGGLAGLVASRHLAAAGIDVVLFEKREACGGRVRSDHEDGYVFDRGFQVVFPNYPAVARELDLGALSLQRFAPGATLVRPGERTTLSDPLREPSALTATLFNRDVTLGDKLRILRLRRALANTPLDELSALDTQTIDEYLAARGFSERFRERFVAPFYGGITLDRSLSTSAYIFGYTFKMLSASRAAVPAEGMGAITDQLAQAARDAGVRIETETTVEQVDSQGERHDADVAVETTAETVEADGVVVATDPPTARELTGVDAIPTKGRGCVTQYFSLSQTQKLAGAKRLLLNVADGRPNQVAVLSSVAPEYAPDGKQLLSATFLGEESTTDEELAQEVREALSAWFPKNTFETLELLRTDRIPFAQLVQRPGFTREWPAVDAPSGPVYLAGEYTRWSSIQGALESGRDAATALQRDRSEL